MYAVVACTPPMIPSHRRIRLFGLVNLGAVLVLACEEQRPDLTVVRVGRRHQGGIAAYLRHEHRPTEMRVELA